MAQSKRVYTAFFDNVTVGTAVQDIFLVKAGSANLIELHSIVLTAGAAISTPVEIRLRLKRGTATITNGSGGSAPSAVPADDNDSAAASSVRANDTTQATTSGAFTTLGAWYWNELMPFELLWPPEDRPVCKAAEGFILDLPAVIAASVSVSGVLTWAE
jgi:hypothetical protein